MTKIVVLLMLGFVAFAWFSLPSPPKPPGEAPSGGHADHGGDPAAFSNGVVVSIDKNAGNLTISHGPIQHLGMPGMTMGFRAGDPALLEGIKPGDKIRFHADVVGGTFTVLKVKALD